MSLSQRSLGWAAVKSRLTRFGEALVWRESVVTRNRRIAWQDSPLCASAWHGIPAARHRLGQQLHMYPGSAVRLAAGLVNGPDPSREVNLTLLAGTGTAETRRIVPAARDLQRLAQGRHAVLPPMLLDEGVLHFASRAK